MVHNISEEEAITRLRHLCSKSEKCRQDIKDKLKSWNFKGGSGQIINKLEEDKFIDEQRFCNAYVRDKIKFSCWGKIKIRYYLKGKKIPDTLIDNTLASFPEDEYKNMVVRELNKKSSTLKVRDKKIHKQKLLAFSKNRGYEPDIIYNIVDKIIELL